jgi:F-type H+-transporting ATPase subunit a
MSSMGLHDVILAELNPLEPVTAVPLFTLHVGPWQIGVSNHACMIGLATVLLMVLLPLAVRSPKFVPSGLQNLVESICVYLRDQAQSVLGPHTDRYMGLLWTTFFFILTLNLLGMVPTEKVATLITGKTSYFGGPPTANIYVTGSLAAVAIILSHAYGIHRQGLFRYLASIAPAVPGWMLPVMYPLEVLSLSIRPFTLAIRLFSNIVAGHMVIGTILGLIFLFKNIGIAAVSVGACVALSLLDLLVAFIQAYIFMFLFALYIGFAISSEH